MSRPQKKEIAAAPQPRRGRPPVITEALRRTRILEAAEQVFTDIGYGATTMEVIARAAGMSKKTLYGMFPDKRALFTALINLTEAYPEEALGLGAANSREELRARFLALAEIALSKRQVEMTRLVVAEAKHCPELAEVFHARLMVKGRAYLTAALQSFADANPDITIPDIEGTAITLFSAVLGDLHFRALLGEKPVSRRKLAAHIDKAMNLVLPNVGR
ncbi:MAG TPA: TetR/AcrR family transcriptional regulator [Hyphomicrobium sp.]|nr:TetR/AcrR family transcriptional regulator [Hyphomicrobium sp.]